MKFASPKDDTCLSIDMVDLTILDHAREILLSGPLYSFLFEPIINYQQGKIIDLWEDGDDEADQGADTRCEETSLVLNWENCHFMVKEGIVLGNKISKSGIKVDREKVDVIAKLHYPTNVKGVRSFLGHARFYRRFIKDFSKIVRPMTKLLMKDAMFIFLDKCIQEFNILKNKFTTTPVIVAPDWNLDFELMCDASDYAVGAVLGQRINKKFCPVYYARKTMNNAQEHYTTTKKELLAVVYAFDKFRSYLIMSKTVVYTDHSALKYLFNKQDAKPMLIRLENPELEKLNEEAIRDSFPDEHLMAIHVRETEADPCCKKFLSIVIWGQPEDIMVPTLLPERYLNQDSTGQLSLKMPQDMFVNAMPARGHEISFPAIRCP
ncbi:reverse transcriptase domain-containing protein [Tanacetum coccineum]|uniref:Reverse transcriptase domain-containing protein n=1 Tax=Tanacetum coccineum TaxID=301880 RepID=A0ABQ5C767_9ASTR